MNFAVLAYILFTISLVVVLVFIIIYYYNPRRKKEVEAPKHRMLDDDEGR
ncbi:MULTISPECIES: cbb3-type cytochrome c oxidase subunit 3 [Prosthecochloris]|uniref:CcoQ/FixQ family Cbb3-type cytochrome c oxidase assembly chaperone n=1 Tax=Prosthecochloris marina TaxID=2017681 RepID=A0A317T501_9CHLB|nr:MULTISPECIES: cbb3-type cytochrome c oxidase subunit 3 [Prosthecochloris]PWW81792.1 CcoQ/FixQ family Cbb3-type cytochrome c oxidase assembly chaperone [Prosthecochloris marina]UZJ38491.1 cbb3-type cytochrome c oxidase subunit 3 [Prosthecochloris sp. SCSIO W1103]